MDEIVSYTQTKPCEACPYRRDAPRGFWSPEEYEKLQAVDAHEHSMVTYGCHLNAKRRKQEPCVGWLLDQKKRGVPSIGLRLRLISNQDAASLFERITGAGLDLYDSIAEMVAANVGKRFPSKDPKAKRLVQKVTGRRRGR